MVGRGFVRARRWLRLRSCSERASRRRRRRTGSGSSWSTTTIAAQISALEKQGYDVGYIGERTEAAVYLDAAAGEPAAAPRATRSARSSPTQHDYATRRAEINATDRG